MIRLIILSILICSCSTGFKKKSSFDETVSVEKNQSSNKADINEQIDQNTYGPVYEKESKNLLDEKNRLPVFALDLVPSLYASLSYLALLKQLEENKIYPNIINTSSFTLVIAVLYAKYKSVNKVEWKLFSLLKKLRNTIIFTPQWLSAIEEFLINEFEDKRIEQLKILVTTPQGKKSQKLIKTGKVVETIMNSLAVSKKDSYINQPHFIYRDKILELGVDIYFCINALPKKFNFYVPNSFVWGLYTGISGMAHSDPSVNFIGHQLLKIDKVPNMSDLFGNANESATFLNDEIKNKYQNWIDKNN